jgi:hypothetical protein
VEPWVTRGLAAVKNTKVLKDQEGILEQGVYIYMKKVWIQKNPGTGRRVRGFRLAEAQLEPQGRLTTPLDYNAGSTTSS